MIILRFMDQINIIINFVKMMKSTFFALCIFALQINKNLAVSLPLPVVCEQGKTCYGLGQDYEGCGNGYCLNRPDDRKKTCHCPYVPPKPKPAVCKQGQECGDPFSKRNPEVCGDGECIWDCQSDPCVIMSNQKFVCFS